MDQKETIKREETIDLLDLAKKLLRYWWVLVLALLIGAFAGGAYSKYMVTPMYQAECMVYVNNGSISVGSTSVSLQDLNASQSLVDTYMVILKSRTVLMEVAERAGVDYSYERMKSMVSAKKVSDTEIFSVYVTSDDPVEAEVIANTIAEVLPDKISAIVEGSSVKIVDYAVIPSVKISPNNSKNTMMGGAAAFVVVALVLVLRILLDQTVQSDTDLFDITRYPILSKVPNQDRNAAKNSRRRRSGHRNIKPVHAKRSGSGKPGTGTTESKKTYENRDSRIGDDLTFDAREAYRLLRTNVIYSLAHGDHGKVIGVTSSIASEFKTTTAINLAISLSRDTGKRVLLLDCDLRMSEIAERMDLDNDLGLTEYLTTELDLNNIIQSTEKYPNLDIIVGGNTSPNPGELLCSDRMHDCLKQLEEWFDFIVIDFPPTNIVSDALELGKYCDGMLVVVRQKYVEKKAVDEALRKLKFLSVNVLGIVMTGVDADPRRRKKYYYNKYYGNYKK